MVACMWSRTPSFSAPRPPTTYVRCSLSGRTSMSAAGYPAITIAPAPGDGWANQGAVSVSEGGGGGESTNCAGCFPTAGRLTLPYPGVPLSDKRRLRERRLQPRLALPGYLRAPVWKHLRKSQHLPQAGELRDGRHTQVRATPNTHRRARQGLQLRELTTRRAANPAPRWLHRSTPEGAVF